MYIYVMYVSASKVIDSDYHSRVMGVNGTLINTDGQWVYTGHYHSRVMGVNGTLSLTGNGCKRDTVTHGQWV